MGDDIAIRKLVNILSSFYGERKDFEEDLAYSITMKCLQNLQRILLIKRMIVYSRWANFIDEFPDCLSSPEIYLRYVIFACRHEAYLNLKIFERFLSVFSLLLSITGETDNRTEVNFRKVIPDIFMLLYEKEMKKTFERRGGFLRFVEYINSHEYLELKLIENYLIFYHNPNSSLSEDLSKEIMKVMSREIKLPNTFAFEDADSDVTCLLWAEIILRRTGIKPPSLLENSNLKEELCEQKIVQSEEEEARQAEATASEKNLECFPNLNSDSETNNIVRQKTDNEWCENVIEAVIKYNHSKNSNHANKKNKILKEVEKILDNLKETIIPLTEIVDEFEKD